MPSAIIDANSTAFIDPFAEADEDTGEQSKAPDYIHIRIQRMFFPVAAAAVIKLPFQKQPLVCSRASLA